MAEVASTFHPAGRLRALAPGVGLALGVFAYRELFLEGLRPLARGFEQWFFEPGQASPLLPIGIAAWMLARRRARLRALPDDAAPALVGALLAAGIGLFVWARLAGEGSLLLPSLAANLLAFAAAARGRAGCRAALLPALVLLLGVPLPAPIRDEIVWRLQLWSAHAATWLIRVSGIGVFLGGVQIDRGDQAFTVIESCCGLRGILILTLMALVVRDFFASSRRSWLVVAIAPVLGFALNVLRIAAVIAFTERPEVEGGAPQSWDHTPQGIAVLVAGTVLLYGLGRWLGARPQPRRPGPDPDRRQARPGAPERPRLAGTGALILLAVLSGLSLAVAPLPGIPLPPPIDVPEELAGWSGEDLTPDRLFVGQFYPGQVLYRRYRLEMPDGPPRVVDLLVGYQSSENPSSRLLSPKLLVPDHDWSLVETRPARLGALGADGELAVGSRNSELVLGYLWRLRDEGLWRETWRAALALDVGPTRRERRRAVVRVTTPLAHAGPDAREEGEQTLERFLADFRDELAEL